MNYYSLVPSKILLTVLVVMADFVHLQASLTLKNSSSQTDRFMANHVSKLKWVLQPPTLWQPLLVKHNEKDFA